MKSLSEGIPGIRNPTEFEILGTVILKKMLMNLEGCIDYLKQMW